MRDSSGKSLDQAPATSNVAQPPTITAGTVPNQAAVTPDSNSPSSLEAPMNTAFTALTRPRISSGVSSCTSRWRTYTLTMSPAPITSSAASDSQKLPEAPNTMVASP